MSTIERDTSHFHVEHEDKDPLVVEAVSTEEKKIGPPTHDEVFNAQLPSDSQPDQPDNNNRWQFIRRGIAVISGWIECLVWICFVIRDSVSIAFGGVLSVYSSLVLLFDGLYMCYRVVCVYKSTVANPWFSSWISYCKFTWYNRMHPCWLKFKHQYFLPVYLPIRVWVRRQWYHLYAYFSDLGNNNPMLACWLVLIAVVMLWTFLMHVFARLVRGQKKKNPKAKINNQSVHSRMVDAYLNLGLFASSLIVNGNLKTWSRYQPWIKCISWLEQIFGDNTCSNFPKCKNADARGDNMCSRCAEQDTYRRLLDDRSLKALVDDPAKAVSLLFSDVVHKRPITWFTSLHMLYKDTVYGDFKDVAKNWLVGELIYSEQSKIFLDSGIVLTLEALAKFSVTHSYMDPNLGCGFYGVIKKLPVALPPEEAKESDLLVGAAAGLNDTYFVIETSQDIPPIKFHSIFGSEVKYPRGVQGMYLKWVGDKHYKLLLVYSDDVVDYPFEGEIRHWLKKFSWIGDHYLAIIAFFFIFVALWLGVTRRDAIIKWFFTKFGAWFGFGVDESVDFGENLDNEIRYNTASARKHKERHVRDEPKDAMWKQRNPRSRDYRIGPTEKRFFFYDANDMEKHIKSFVGLKMVDPNDHTKVVYVKDAEEYKSMDDGGFVPIVETVTSFVVPWDKYELDRSGWNLFFKYLQWADRYPNTKQRLPANYNSYFTDLIQYNKDDKSMLPVLEAMKVYEKNATRKSSPSPGEAGLFRRWAADSWGTLFTPTDRGVVDPVPQHMRSNESVSFDEYDRSRTKIMSRNFKDESKLYVPPPLVSRAKSALLEETQDESNISTIDTDICPYEVLHKICTSKTQCVRRHVNQASEDKHNESIMYPVKQVIDTQCSYPMYIKEGDNYLRVAMCVRVGSGFLTTRHTFMNGDKLLRPINQYYVYEASTDKYFSVSALDLGEPEKIAGIMGVVWDFSKFDCSDKDFMKRSLLTHATPSPYYEEFASSVRLVKFDEKKHLVYTDEGVRIQTDANQIYYRLNTTAGDSGSGIFDMNGRLIGLHKKGNPNSGVLFTIQKVVPSYFLAQSPSKNYQTPVIQL